MSIDICSSQYSVLSLENVLFLFLRDQRFASVGRRRRRHVFNKPRELSAGDSESGLMLGINKVLVGFALAGVD